MLPWVNDCFTWERLTPMPIWPAPPPAIEAAKTSENWAAAPLKPTVPALETLLLTASRPFAAAFSPLKPC